MSDLDWNLKDAFNFSLSKCTLFSIFYVFFFNREECFSICKFIKLPSKLSRSLQKRCKLNANFALALPRQKEFAWQALVMPLLGVATATEASAAYRRMRHGGDNGTWR